MILNLDLTWKEAIFEKEIDDLDYGDSQSAIITAKACINSKWLIIVQGKEEDIIIRRFDIEDGYQEVHPPIELGENIAIGANSNFSKLDSIISLKLDEHKYDATIANTKEMVRKLSRDESSALSRVSSLKKSGQI
jgi:hypothetical protein